MIKLSVSLSIDKFVPMLRLLSPRSKILDFLKCVGNLEIVAFLACSKLEHSIRK